MLIGKSKVKAYVKGKDLGLKISKKYYELLNEVVKKMIDENIVNTQKAKKKTLGHYSFVDIGFEEEESCPCSESKAESNITGHPAEVPELEEIPETTNNFTE